METCIKCGAPFDGKHGLAIKYDETHWIHESCLAGTEDE